MDFREAPESLCTGVSHEGLARRSRFQSRPCGKHDWGLMPRPTARLPAIGKRRLGAWRKADYLDTGI